MSERVLITGGAGFIGSHLADRLIAGGESVVALDDLSTGRIENVAHLAGDARFELAEGSVLDEALVEELVARTDRIVHLAAAVGVKLIVERPLESLRTNIRGTEHVLDAAVRHGRPVLVASTSEVYGRGLDVALGETDDSVFGHPGIARWSYGLAKAVDEALTLATGREHGIPVVVCRFFNTVGPRQVGSYGMVLPRLAQQAVRGEPLTVYGDGGQTRVFCHVGDTVRAVEMLMASAASAGATYNVGGTERISILDLAARVVAAAGTDSSIELVPYRDAYGDGFEDIRHRIPDTTRIRERCGWTTQISLDRLIEEVVADARGAAEAVAAAGGSR